MNNTTAINTNLSTIEFRKQTSEQRQNHEYRECFDGCQMGGNCGGEWVKR